VQPYGSTQAAEREDILNIGGFSDAVFEIIAAFAARRVECRSLGRSDRKDRPAIVALPPAPIRARAGWTRNLRRMPVGLHL
jgi:hypothetical protein